MNTEEFQHRWGDGHSVHLYRWLPDASAPHAVVQIIHGMADHAGRYARLAEALAAAGYAVYAADLPGHGKTARAGELGHFADSDGWSVAKASIRAVHRLAARQQSHKPIFMLGHSMGSFLLQDYLIEHGGELAGAVLSATRGSLGPLRPVGLILMQLEALLLGVRHRSALAKALTFKGYNKKFKPTRTDSDWLSRDPVEVDKYIADPFCGQESSCGLWTSLLSAGGRLNDAKRLRKIPAQLPVLMVAGGADPMSNGGKGPPALERVYRKAGLTDVSVRIYPGGRHELFNDTCREQVTADLLEWLTNRLPHARS